MRGGGALALTGGTVVTSLSPPRLARADLLVRDGRVAEPGDAGLPTGAPRLDCSGCVVIPGNVCAHHHLYSALARGMPYRLPPPRTFVEVLRRVWWRLDRALDEDTVRASAALGGLEALLAGTTTVVDHHASPSVAGPGCLELVASALEELGLRSVLCYEVSDRDGPDVARAGLELQRAFLERPRERTRGMVGAHASFTLSEDTLAACVELAREFQVGLHVHVAEDATDQADCLARFGTRVIHRLDRAGALDERALLAHCVHVDQGEVEAIHARGATVVHNARSNMNNRVGHAPVGAFRRLALGTDGIDGDLFAESRAAYWRAREADPRVGPPWVLERLAESARFAGRAFGEPLLGALEPGAPADLVVLEYDPPTPLEPETLAAHWVFGLSARHVRDVVVGGELVVRDRRPTRVDPAEVAARARRAAERLWGRLDELDEHPFVPAGVPATA
ncbi:MAG TPA: amidohydrolase family protein [Actinomycetota bacterium]|nr:amidohydrolase family protein [Actinomycetota bacterium]